MTSTSTTLNQNTLNNRTNSLQYAIDANLLNVNTMLPCEIFNVNGDGTYDIIPIVNILDANGEPHINPKIHEVPAIQIVGGNAGIIIEYQVGDVVYVGFCQRDISSIKKTWQTGNPPSYRLHDLADGVILGKLSNTPPTVYVKITSEGVEITAPSLPVTINAETINLGENASNRLLLEGVEMTANIGGVQPGSGVTGVPVTITAGGAERIFGLP